MGFTMNRVKAEIIDQSIIGRDFYYFRFMKNDTLQYNVMSMGLPIRNFPRFQNSLTEEGKDSMPSLELLANEFKRKNQLYDKKLVSSFNHLFMPCCLFCIFIKSQKRLAISSASYL